MSHTSLIILFVVLGTLQNNLQAYAATVYGLTYGPRGENLVSIDNSTGKFKIIAADTLSNGAMEVPISCFDQSNNVFYFATGDALYPVDTKKGIVLPLINYVNGQTFSCHCTDSNVLVALGAAVTDWFFMLESYPLAPNTGAPKMLANLTADNITWTQGQAYDSVNNIFYSVAVNSLLELHRLVLHQVDLNDPTHATQALFPCLPRVLYFKYDSVQNALVGLGENYTTVNNTIFTEIYSFVVNPDGSCTLSGRLPNIGEISAITYDPYTATFYLCTVSYAGAELCMFETKTSKVTTLEIPGILDYMEVAYF
eukprot:Phypoly_transcript_12630.p1 GENE.Phypoly_transcript_12630~~Phypoly_transcript_12630.p1  ORF type:complete len:311 (+),score=17.02 Phypoly_transcript_12630:114-1046(+)